jgi:hypothetical protein
MHISYDVHDLVVRGTSKQAFPVIIHSVFDAEGIHRCHL